MLLLVNLRRDGFRHFSRCEYYKRDEQCSEFYHTPQTFCLEFRQVLLDGPLGTDQTRQSVDDEENYETIRNLASRLHSLLTWKKLFG